MHSFLSFSSVRVLLKHTLFSTKGDIYFWWFTAHNTCLDVKTHSLRENSEQLLMISESFSSLRTKLNLKAMFCLLFDLSWVVVNLNQNSLKIWFSQIVKYVKHMNIWIKGIKHLKPIEAIKAIKFKNNLFTFVAILVLISIHIYLRISRDYQSKRKLYSIKNFLSLPLLGAVPFHSLSFNFNVCVNWIKGQIVGWVCPESGLLTLTKSHIFSTFMHKIISVFIQMSISTNKWKDVRKWHIVGH